MSGFYEVMIERNFSSAHQLRGYKGKCENLHGHNYKIEIYAKGAELNNIGLLIDFVELKKAAAQAKEADQERAAAEKQLEKATAAADEARQQARKTAAEAEEAAQAVEDAERALEKAAAALEELE